MESKTGVLKNGMRIVYMHSGSAVSHCGLMIGTGSRDEEKGKEGLAHFIEHMLFKGTKKRKAYQVLNRLEVVGGELNAFTGKEDTCIHASYLTEHAPRAFELIADVVFQSVFPEKEMKKEKDVILDEINSYQDNPMEQIYDDFECLVFRGQPLGNPILGTPASVVSFTRSDLERFVKKNYTTGRMVFSYSGSLPFRKVTEMCELYFGAGNSKRDSRPAKVVRPRSGKMVNQPRNTIQAHYITGTTAYSIHSSKRFSLFLMNNILGGPGMNSRLNMNIREKYGFTYHIESSYVPFRDSGLFNVYLATEQKYIDKTVGLVNREFKKLKTERMGTAQMARYKYQLKGQLAIAQENRAGLMINNAKSMLNYNKPADMEEVFRKLDQITSSDLLAVANEILDERRASSLMYTPVTLKT